MEPKHGHRVRERPGEGRAETEVLEEQDGNQCCPNLNQKGVLRCSHEGLNLQILLDRLEKDLDLPPVLVHRSLTRSVPETQETPRLQHLYVLLFWVSLIIALAVTMIAGPLTRFLFGQAYEGTGAVLSILIWNCVFVFFNFINEKWIIAENIQRMWLFVAPAGFLLNGVFNYFFIRKMGIQGAAVASLLTFFFVSHLAFLVTGKTSRICLMQWKALVMPFLGLKRLFGRVS